MRAQRLKLVELDRPVCADPSVGCFRVRVGDRVEIVVPEGFDPREFLALLMMLKEAGE